MKEILERRYTLTPFKKEIKGLKDAFRRASLRNLDSMRKRGFRPKNISYYEEVILGEKRYEELKGFSGRIIGYFCTFIPQELIYAARAIPIRLCSGFYDTVLVCEEILAKDICPLVKSSFGFKISASSYFELCDAVILPTPCDPKKKLIEILSDYLPVWVLKIPQDKTSSSKEIWLEEIKSLKERIEDFTKTKLTRQRLEETIKLIHKRQTLFRQLYEIRRANPYLMGGRDFLLVIQTSFYDDIERWIDKTEELCKQLSKEKTHFKTDEKIKILVTGSPIIWPNFKLLNIIEDLGAEIVCDDLCSGTQSLYNLVEPDEPTTDVMLGAIADGYLLSSVCPCFIENNDRIDRVLNLIEEFRVGGVIYHSLRLCQLYEIESHRLRLILKEKKIPMLTIHTDYSQEDTEQIKTRVEAFLEMLKR